MHLSIARDELLPGRNFIGQLCDAEDGCRFDVTDPATNAAFDSLTAARLGDGGQTCVSPNRVLVQAGVYDLFVDKLGASIVVVDHRPPALGPNYYAPTLLVGASASMACSCEDTFGGVKESGYGSTGTVHELDDYISLKYVCQGNLR